MVWVGDGETGKGELGRRKKKMKSIGEGGIGKGGDGVRKRLKDERPASNVEGEK